MFPKTVHILAIVLLLSSCSKYSADEQIIGIKKAIENSESQKAIVSAKFLLKHAKEENLRNVDQIANLLLARAYFDVGNYTNALSHYKVLLVDNIEGSTEEDWHVMLYSAIDIMDKKLIPEILTNKNNPMNDDDKEVYSIRLSVLKGDIEDSLLILSLADIALRKKMSYWTSLHFQLMQVRFDLERTLSNLIELEKVSKIPEISFHLARLRQLNKQKLLSFENYGKYEKLRPENIKAKLLLSGAAIQVGRLDFAREKINSLPAQIQKTPYGNQIRAVLAFENKEYKSAANFANQSISRGYDTIMNRIIVGISSYHLDLLEQTHNHLSKVNKSAPNIKLVQQYLTSTELRLNNPEKAADLFKSTDISNANDVSMANKISLELLKSGLWSESNIIQQRVANFPAIKGMPEHSALSETLVQLSKQQEFRSHLSRAVALTDNTFQNRVLLILASLAERNIVKAKELHLEWKNLTVEKGIESSTFFNISALLALAEKETKKAREFLNKSLLLQPDNLSSLILLLELNKEQEKWDINLALSKDILFTQKLINIEVFRHFIFSQLELNKLNIDSIKELISLDLEKDFELAFVRILVNKKENELLARYLSSIESSQWKERHHKLSIDLAFITNDKELVQQRINSFLINTRFESLSSLVFIIARAADNNDYELVLSMLDRAKNKNISIKNQEFIKVKSLINLARYEEAKIILSSLDKKEQLYFDAQYQLSMAKSKYDDAFKFLQKSISLGPTIEQIKALIQLGNQLHRLEEVETVIKAIVKEYQDDISFIANISLLCVKELPELTINIIEQPSLANHLKADYILLNNLAWLYYKKDNLSKAKELIKKAIALNPNNKQVINSYKVIFTH